MLSGKFLILQPTHKKYQKSISIKNKKLIKRDKKHRILLTDRVQLYFK